MEKTWRDYFTILILALISALIVRLLFLTAYKVPTGSMQPSLKPGDFIFAFRSSYGVKLPIINSKVYASNPERGDVIVFSYPNQLDVVYVKRVIALPGDKVQILKSKLYINGIVANYTTLNTDLEDNPGPKDFNLQTEEILDTQTRILTSMQSTLSDFGPIVVPPGEYFVLGDNRDASDDSRHWGTVPSALIFGRVGFIWLSIDFQNRGSFTGLPQLRWSRIFKLVH